MADIVVIGSLNMDLVVTAQRAPEAGETLSGDTFRTIPGGKGANQAVAAAKAGGRVAMLGRVGDDDFGRELQAALAQYGVDTTHVATDASTPTGIAMITVEASGKNRILIVAGANGCVVPADLDAAIQIIQQAKIMVLQLEIPLETVAHALRLAHEAGVATMLNVAPAYPLPDDLLALVTYLIVNEGEAQLLSDCPVTDGVTAQQAAAVLLERGVTAVILTLGSDGALLANREQMVYVEPYEVTAVDTTAAGDSFIGVFAAVLAEDRSLRDAVHLGNAAGALAVTKPGAQPAIPYRREIETLTNAL